MNYLKPEFGKSYTIALRSAEPKATKGFNGPELRWILANGQALYTPVAFGERIRELGIKPGQKFTFIRYYEKDQIVWKIERLAQPVAELLNGEDLDSPFEVVAINESKIDRALKIAIQSAASAERYGQQLGYPIRFTPLDIREMAIEIYQGK